MAFAIFVIQRKQVSGGRDIQQRVGLAVDKAEVTRQFRRHLGWTKNLQSENFQARSV